MFGMARRRANETLDHCGLPRDPARPLPVGGATSRRECNGTPALGLLTSIGAVSLPFCAFSLGEAMKPQPRKPRRTPSNPLPPPSRPPPPLLTPERLEKI